MAQLGDLIVSGKSRFLNTINTSEIDLTTDSTHYGSITPTKIKYQDGTYNQTELTGNKLEVKTNQNSTSVTPSTLEISSSTKKLTIVANDITKTNETWDGTNASLTTAVTNAKDTVKQNVLSTPSTNSYKLLLSGSADASAHTEGVYKYSTLEFTPDNDASVFDGNTLSMYNNSWETVIRLSCGTNPYVYVKDSSPKYLKAYNTDIVLGDWNGTSNTWDGTNTSLVTAVTSAKDTVKQHIINSSTGAFDVILSGSASGGATGTGYVYKSSNLTFNPSYSNATMTSGLLCVNGKSTSNVNYSLKMYSNDIVLSGTSSTWDGTNTSLVTAVTQLKNTKADILAETIPNLTFSTGVATLAKKTGYILISIYPYARTDDGYGITSFTEQNDGSYKIRNHYAGLSASLKARAIWLKV